MSQEFSGKLIQDGSQDVFFSQSEMMTQHRRQHKFNSCILGMQQSRKLGR